MNLAEVLNVALPELPTRRLSTSYPRLHPNVIAREQMEGGVPTMVAMVSGGSYVMRFTPDQWKLIQLFNGQRSYGELIELYQQESGVAFAEEDVRNFVDSLEEGGIWYRTSLELNSTVTKKLADNAAAEPRKKRSIADDLLYLGS